MDDRDQDRRNEGYEIQQEMNQDSLYQEYVERVEVITKVAEFDKEAGVWLANKWGMSECMEKL